MDSIAMIANANRCCRNVGSIVAIDSSRSSTIGCSVKLFLEGGFFDFSHPAGRVPWGESSANLPVMQLTPATTK
jgi:hypothetical protein